MENFTQLLSQTRTDMTTIGDALQEYSEEAMEMMQVTSSLMTNHTFILQITG
jgi:hypothetical protein